MYVSQISRKKCYEGVQFNVMSVTRGWVGVHFLGKKRYVTLEWPQIATCSLLVILIIFLTNFLNLCFNKTEKYVHSNL